MARKQSGDIILSEIEVIIPKDDYDENEEERVQRKKAIFDQTMSLLKFYKSLLQTIKDKKV